MSFGKFKDDKSGQDTSAAKGAVSSNRGVASSSDAILGVGSSVVGTLRFEGASEISGSVEGEIFAEGKLTIGETAKVKARVQGVEIVVRGTVEGDIVATKKLALLRPARITGNIASASLSIEEGVVFEGGCEMLKSTSATKSQTDASKDSSSKPSDVVA